MYTTSSSEHQIGSNLPRLLDYAPLFVILGFGFRWSNICCHLDLWHLLCLRLFFWVLMRRLSDHRSIPIGNLVFVWAAFFTLSTWVLIRVQHIFLLCGYALVTLSWTWRVWEKNLGMVSDHLLSNQPSQSFVIT